MIEHDRFPASPTSWPEGPDFSDDFDDRLLVSRSPEDTTEFHLADGRTPTED